MTPAEAATGVDLDGLPEGVVAVAVRKPISGDIVWEAGEMIGYGEGNWGLHLIVKPAPGWAFRYDITRNRNVPVQQYEQPKQLTATFTVADSLEEAAVRSIKAGSPVFEE